MTSPPLLSRPEDRSITALALTLCALSLGYAVNLKLGNYGPEPLFWLTVGILFCIAAITLPFNLQLESICFGALPLALATCIAIQSYLVLHEYGEDHRVSLCLAVISVLGFAQFFKLRGLRIPLIAIMAIAFFFAGEIAFNVHGKNPGIDVFNFQFDASYALQHWQNPYLFKYPNIYGPNTPFYGPGVVDSQGMLTVGFPYPPLSALMVFPAYVIGGDVRYAMVIAMAVSAILMTAARPGRIAALAGAVFLLNPRVLYVIDNSWTEPLFVLTFSLTMFCACRCRKALPYALGLYFSTKQYSVLALPLLPLLLEGPASWKSLRDILVKAGLVVAAINLPFFFLNPHAFIRSIVVFQFLQPFRIDALSYLVFIRKNFQGDLKFPIWISFLPVIPAIYLSLRRLPRSPAGFAAGITFVHLAFFAFNKQAFCNYYYFVIATACWSIAATRSPRITSALASPAQ